MLTLEQYRDPKLAQLHHDYLAGGPLEYMAAIFRKMTDSDEDAMQLALEFYGPMYLLYSVYDGAEEKNRYLPCWPPILTILYPKWSLDTERTEKQHEYYRYIFHRPEDAVMYL